MTNILDEKFYQTIVEHAPDGVIFADRQGIIRLWNPGAEAIFGHTAGEAVGQTLDLIVPERFREVHWTGYNRAVATGETKYAGQVLPTRSVTRDGRTIYVDMTLAILRDGAGQVFGVLAVTRDVTERRAQERATRERIAELERQVGTPPGQGG